MIWLKSYKRRIVPLFHSTHLCPPTTFDTSHKNTDKGLTLSITPGNKRPLSAWYVFYFFLTHGSSKRHDGRPENTVKRKGPLKIHDFLAEPYTRMDKKRINQGEESMAPWSGFVIWNGHRCNGDSCLSRLELRSRSPFAFLHFIKIQTLSFCHEESEIP